MKTTPVESFQMDTRPGVNLLGGGVLRWGSDESWKTRRTVQRKGGAAYWKVTVMGPSAAGAETWALAGGACGAGGGVGAVTICVGRGVGSP